jgi:3-oxoadipate enol-lactonase
MSKLTIGNDFFNIECDGPESAPVLLLSNSLGTNLHMWDKQIPVLSAAFRVIRYDSRGHGQSIVTQGPYSIAQLGQDALAILDALGVERAHFIGLSLGGMVGQWLLTHAPHRLERVILANTAALMAPAHNWNARMRTVRAKGMSAITSAIVSRWFTPAFQQKSPADVGLITNMLLTTPAEGYNACCSAIRDMDQRESVRAASRPTLVIIGDQDPATPPALGRELAGFIKGAQSKLLRAAHLSNIEADKAFTAAAVAFLTQKATAAKTKTKVKVKTKTKTKVKPKAKASTKAKTKTKPKAKAASHKASAAKTKIKTKTKVTAKAKTKAKTSARKGKR